MYNRNRISNLLFILPALAMFCVFSVYPFVKTFQLSAFQWDGVSRHMQFVGLSNYKDILFNNPTFWHSMGAAGYIALLALIIQNALALLLAVLVDRGVKAQNFFRTTFFLPPVLSFIVVALIWKWIYNPSYGILNFGLTGLGITQFHDFGWLSEAKTALTSVAVVHMWKGFGWGFIILLAGLQGIPRELYESASIDGASAWQQFRHVTVPLMIPTFVIVSILTILGSMQIFDLIYGMTRGGPAGLTHVPITRIYEYMNNGEFGYATAMAVVFGLVLLIVSLVQINVSRRASQNI